MTPSCSNILTFPSPARLQAAVAQPIKRSICLEELNKLSVEERADYVASIVRPAIRFGRRKGGGRASLPRQLRVWLLNLCDLGDPTCLVVRNWLDGNPAFVAALEEGDA